MMSTIKGNLDSYIFAEMLKQLAVILLITAFVTQTFNNGFVMLNYYTNTAAFAKNCVNKAKPKMHCNGKCQLMRKLLEEEKKDQQMPERKFEKKTEIICSNTTVASTNPAGSILLPFVYHSCFAAEQKMPRTIFHPPGA